MVELVHAVNKARKIRRFLMKHNLKAENTTLRGFCGVASVLLAASLKDPSNLRLNSYHAWNIIDDTIIDITATQFYSKFPEVYIGTPRDFHTRVIASGLAAYECIRDWPYEDIPGWVKLSSYWDI